MTPSLNSNTSVPTRSISWPSRSLPLLPEIEEQLRRLKSFKSASTSSLAVNVLVPPNSRHEKLAYSREDLLLLQSSQESLTKDQGKRCADDLLDGSVMLLDVCGISKDALASIRSCSQAIQSSLRRRVSGELSIIAKVVEYMSCRKKLSKTLKRSLKDLRIMVDQGSKKISGNGGLNGLLRESEVVAETLKSLLLFIAGSMVHLKKCRWSVVSKLLLWTSATKGEKLSS